MATRNITPSWSNVKASLADVGRDALLGLIHDMYSASKDNKLFLHSRFALGGDTLKPYKTVIERWLYPDAFKNQSVSVAKAKRAIADYKKAVGSADGLAELKVFYCERTARFSENFGMQDESYFDAMLRMFEQALKTIVSLAAPKRPALWERLNDVRTICRNFGYGVSDDMGDLLHKYSVDG